MNPRPPTMKTRPWVFHRHGRFWTISSPVGRVEDGLVREFEEVMAGFDSSGASAPFLGSWCHE
jgi:hypothetical protein